MKTYEERWAACSVLMENFNPKRLIPLVELMVKLRSTSPGAVGADSVTLMVLYERQPGQESEATSQSSAVKFGFAFLDAAAGRYYLGSIGDDAGRANLTSVLTQVMTSTGLVVFIQGLRYEEG